MAKLSARKKQELDKVGALVPVGGILAYAPGYFSSSGNGGSWSISGPSNNTVAAINTFLDGYWKVCDGTAPNDSDSPIFNSAGKYLPDLTDDRFIRGSTAAGVVGNAAFSGSGSGSLPSHNHSISHTHIWSYYNGSGSGDNTYSLSSSDISKTSISASDTEFLDGFAGYGAGGSAASSQILPSAGSFYTTGVISPPQGSSGSGALSGDTSGATVNVTVSGSTCTPKFLSVFYIMRVK